MSDLTLFDLTYRVARELGIVAEGTATGGTTTTVVDTNDRTEADDYWNGGTLWLLRDAGGAGAAPEGEFSVVSDFANGSKTITLRTALTAAPASGDKYAIGKRRFPLPIVIQSVNKALQDLGTIPQSDASLTAGATQTEYTLPVAASQDLRQVYVQGVQRANDNRWTKVLNWRIHRTATGTGDLLVLPSTLISGYTIKLVYAAPHPELHAFSGQLNEMIPVERVTPRATLHALMWYRDKTRTNASAILDKINYYDQLSRENEVRYPIQIPARAGRLVLAPDGSGARYPGDRTPR